MPLELHQLHELLLRVERPARYIGGELGSGARPAAALRWALAFPDCYEVGESHLGLKLLYRVINADERLAAERVYAPWPDMAAELRRAGLPLYSLEGLRPLGEFDLVGFSLPHELCYTTVLAMLELGGLPLRASERTARQPLVVAGGAQALNPEPLAPFIDAFVVGDGEQAVLAVSDLLLAERGRARSELLERLGALPGVYVPALARPRYTGRLVAGWSDARDRPAPAPRVRRQRLRLLADSPAPAAIVPWVRPVHDRVTVEIQRGCDHGCRFCSAGMTTRPVRQRPAEQVLALLRAGVEATGNAEVGLLSLSAADHPAIDEILAEAIAWGEDRGVAISLPSLRLDSLRPEVAQLVARARRTGFTLAPEAASERLRRVINKPYTDADLRAAAQVAVHAGWRRLKLYFMLGLPTERDEDILAIGDLVASLQADARPARLEISVSAGAFVPKPHTPFQWEAQVVGPELARRQELLQRRLRSLRGVKLSTPQPGQTWLEGLLARGDRRLAALLEAARRAGAYLDGWGEHFDWPAWQRALAAIGPALDPAALHDGLPLVGALPWEHLASGVGRGYLLRERARALSATVTPSGLSAARRARTHGAGLPAGPPPARPEPRPGQEPEAIVRVRYAKHGRPAYLGHLELMAQVLQALRRAALPLAMSGGHHPAPRVGFGPALPLGYTSDAEFVDVALRQPVAGDELADRLAAQLPEGLRVLGAWPLTRGESAACDAATMTRYLVTLPEAVDLTDVDARLQALLDAPSFGLLVSRKGKRKLLDLRAHLAGAERHDQQLLLTLRHFQGGGPRLRECLAALLPPGAPPLLRAHKQDVALRYAGQGAPPPLPPDLPVAFDACALDEH